MMAMYMGKAHYVQVASRTRDAVLYRVFVTESGVVACDCPAGRNGKRCWHLDAAIAEVEAVEDMIREGHPKPLGSATVPDGVDFTVSGPARVEVYAE